MMNVRCICEWRYGGRWLGTQFERSGFSTPRVLCRESNSRQRLGSGLCSSGAQCTNHALRPSNLRQTPRIDRSVSHESIVAISIGPPSQKTQFFDWNDPSSSLRNTGLSRCSPESSPSPTCGKDFRRYQVSDQECTHGGETIFLRKTLVTANFPVYVTQN
jgi:hypothetical protein